VGFSKSKKSVKNSQMNVPPRLEAMVMAVVKYGSKTWRLRKAEAHLLNNYNGIAYGQF